MADAFWLRSHPLSVHLESVVHVSGSGWGRHLLLAGCRIPFAAIASSLAERYGCGDSLEKEWRRWLPSWQSMCRWMRPRCGVGNGGSFQKFSVRAKTGLCICDTTSDTLFI